MTAIWMRMRSELRSRLAGVLVLGLIVGVIGGVVIAAAAGARRTDTAYERFLQATRAADIIVTPGPNAARERRQVEHLPQVVGTTSALLASGRLAFPSGREVRVPDVFPILSRDGRFGTSLNAMKILSGRAPDQRRPDEVAVSFPVADRFGIHLGDTLRIALTGGDPFITSTSPAKKTVPVHVVGIEAMAGEFGLAGAYIPGLHLTRAFYRAHRDLIHPDPSFAVRLRHGGADLTAFLRETAALPGLTQSFNIAQQATGVESATRTEAVALWVLAALVAVAGVAVVGQMLGRQTFLGSAEHPALRALGVSTTQLFALGVLRAAAIGTLGAAVAAGVAMLLSPLAPTGLARIAEPHPGFAVDAAVMSVGAAALLAVVLLLGIVPSWRAAVAGEWIHPIDRSASKRPSTVASALARASMPPSAVVGTRMALESGRGRTAVPVRATMLGAALGIAGLAAALAFGASLHRLIDTPRLSGWNWSAIVGTNAPAATPRLVDAASADPRVRATALGAFTELRINGTASADALAIEPHKATITTAIVAGRQPEGPHEIALVARTMRSLGVGIGDTVRVRRTTSSGAVAGSTLHMRVVGQIALPTFFFSANQAGEGASIAPAAMREIDPRAFGVGLVFLRLARGATLTPVVADLQRSVGQVFDLPPQQNGQIHGLGDIGNIPLLLAGIVGLMAAATLAHTLVTSIRRRRRDIAILKTIGFVRRQVSAAVAWQATLLAFVAVVVGVPVGVAAGRWSWNAFADRLGVVPVSVVPIVAVLLVAPAALIAANLIAYVPGRIGARVHPAEDLRAE